MLTRVYLAHHDTGPDFIMASIVYVYASLFCCYVDMICHCVLLWLICSPKCCCVWHFRATVIKDAELVIPFKNERKHLCLQFPALMCFFIDVNTNFKVAVIDIFINSSNDCAWCEKAHSLCWTHRELWLNSAVPLSSKEHFTVLSWLFWFSGLQLFGWVSRLLSTQSFQLW